MKIKLILASLCLAALGLAALGLAAVGLASPTRADVLWQIDGTFADGGTLKGNVDINVYGYLESFSLTTSAGSVLGGTTYDNADGFGGLNTQGNVLDVHFGGYDNTLQLTFENSLKTKAAVNSLLTAAASSFECQGSYSCPAATETRYFNAGVAAAPEPRSWALLLLGFGGLTLLRRRVAIAA